jgi:two-component system CheB/CheR fusion protein
MGEVTLSSRQRAGVPIADGLSSSSVAPAIEDDARVVMETLRKAGRFDFASYTRSALLRRIHERVAQLGLHSFREYAGRLSSEDEQAQLSSAVVVQKSEFFRNPSAWAHLAAVVASIAGRKGRREPIRIWTAGCATGEEAYSLALVVAELLGLEALQDRVRIFATDVSDTAIFAARQARYVEAQLANVPAHLLSKYFACQGAAWVAIPRLRRGIVFARQDLLRDRPLPRMDLIACRNTLLYFNRASQRRVLRRFHSSLLERGLLFTGRCELAHVMSRLFQPVSLEHRIFKCAGAAGERGSLSS